MITKKITTLFFILTLMTLDSFGAVAAEDWQQLWRGIPPSKENLQLMYPESAYRVEAGLSDRGYFLEIWNIEDGIPESIYHKTEPFIDPVIFGNFHFSVTFAQLNIFDITSDRRVDIVSPDRYLDIGKIETSGKLFQHIEKGAGLKNTASRAPMVTPSRETALEELVGSRKKISRMLFPDDVTRDPTK
ncbi:MAG: hypothetical protein WCG05_04875 [Alphaproteobacteria bacterium]